MRAYDDADVELAPLRIDRLAPDILLGIFNGKVTKLTVKQPPEGLHFGLSPKGNGQYERASLRKVTEASGGVEPGAQIPDGNDKGIAIQAPMRRPLDPSRPTRALRVAELAKQFATALAGLKHPAAKLTSAELAVQMIESPGFVTFTAAK
jgi:hypothetical protein